LVVHLDNSVGALAEAWLFLEGTAHLFHINLALAHISLRKYELVH